MDNRPSVDHPQAQSDVAPLWSVIVRPARDAFRDEAQIAREWQALGYLAPPDRAAAIDEHDRFVELLTEAGAQVIALPPADDLTLDALYVRDAAVVCRRGVILCNMGKPARAGEPAAMARSLSGLGIPVIGAIQPPGRLEGGDVAWLDTRTLCAGRGYRSNDAGIAQLRELLADAIDELVVVPLPHFRGPADVFHLMSIWSPIDRDLALVYSRLMPVPFRELLLARGIELVEVPDEEFDSLGGNALAMAPRRVLLAAGNPLTRRRLELAGVSVTEFAAQEICLKGSGGPTCLTRPLWRG